MGKGLGAFAFWRGNWVAKVHAAPAGVSAFAAASGRAATAAAFATATATRAIECADCPHLDLIVLGDHIIHAPIKSEACKQFGSFIGGGLDPEAEGRSRVRNPSVNCSHAASLPRCHQIQADAILGIE